MRPAGQKGVPLACVLIACALGTAPRLAHAQTSDLAKPRSAVEIVLDSSRVMGRERLSAARAAIARAAGALPEGTPLGLRVYGNKAPAKDKGASCVDSRAAAPVGPADPAALSSALKDLKPTGRAPLSLALTRAKKDLPASGERTIVLVAGGADSCATPSPCQPIGSAGAVPPVRVDVIGLQVDAAARRALQCSALTSAGVYRDASTPDALGPELSAALDRATRDRRSLGKPLAGGLEEAQGTFAKPGQYVDSIGPDTERWYTVPVARGRVLSVAATLVAPPTGDVSAPGSSLDLQATNVRSSGGSLAPGTTVAPTATNLFAFDPSRSITVSLTTRP
ncbi:MAG TPA: hypothetical protein VGI67_00065, partial [Thermoleophilaceae bacterium]